MSYIFWQRGISGIRLVSECWGLIQEPHTHLGSCWGVSAATSPLQRNTHTHWRSQEPCIDPQHSETSLPPELPRCQKIYDSVFLIKKSLYRDVFIWSERYQWMLSVFGHAIFPAIFSGVSHQKAMGLGALEARGQRAFNGSKITEIDL